MPTLPTRYLTILCDALERQGLPTAEWRHACGIAPPHAGEDGTLDVAQLERFLEFGRAQSGRIDLGFELGLHLKLNDHDLLGYGLLSCSTLDDLLRMASRCYSAITRMFTLQYRREPDHGEAIYAPAVSLPPMTLAFFLEALAVSHFTQARALLGAQAACEMSLGMAAPPHIERYRPFAPARIRFDPSQPHTVRVRMSDALLRHPLAMASPAVVARVMRYYADRGELAHAQDLVSQVTNMLCEYERLATQDDIARRLGISTRTLARRLAAAGHPFRTLAQRVRWELAVRWLAMDGATITDVAHRLGYGDTTNFTRAFRRATGMTPGHAQRNARAERRGGGK